MSFKKSEHHSKFSEGFQKGCAVVHCHSSQTSPFSAMLWKTSHFSDISPIMKFAFCWMVPQRTFSWQHSIKFKFSDKPSVFWQSFGKTVISLIVPLQNLCYDQLQYGTFYPESYFWSTNCQIFPEKALFILVFLKLRYFSPTFF